MNKLAKQIVPKKQPGNRVEPRRVSSCRCVGAGGVNQPCHGFTGGVNKNGGDVLRNPKVVALLWGYYFASNPGVGAAVDQFYSDVFASNYLDGLEQYGVSGATYVGSRVVYGGLHPGQGGVVSQIQSWLANGLLPIPNSTADAANWLYVLIPPPGEVVFDNGDESDVDLCGYHDHNSFHFSGDGFGNLVTSGCLFWVGDFSGSGDDQVLFYHPSDGNWWLGTFSGNQMSWNLAGNTTGFGNIAKDPFFLGDFTGSGQSSILFYSPGDGNWWLGTFSGTQMTWNLAGNTGKPGTGFGNLVTSGCLFWTGTFSGSSNDQILFYHPSDGNWWIGSFSGNQMSWNLAGNTLGFGNISKDPFFLGNFTGNGHPSLLFYSPGDGNWWLGTFTGTQMTWNLAGNTGKPGTGFGNLVTSGCLFWVGDFSGSGDDQVLFYHPSDGNWWLGTFSGNQMSWNLAGNTTGFGNIAKDPFFLGDFTGSGQSSILFYSPGDGNWWLGTFSGNQVSWNLAGNTKGFGNISKDPFFVGNFTGNGQSSVLFYSPGDGNWWLGMFSGNQMSWNLAGNTGVTVNFSADVPYAVVAFPAPSGIGGATDLVNRIAYCLSHETVEAFSNPRGNGFYNNGNGCEIADICEVNPQTGAIATVNIGVWAVEQYWSNQASACVSS